jgi:hypothetical protein
LPGMSSRFGPVDITPSNRTELLAGTTKSGQLPLS